MNKKTQNDIAHLIFDQVVKFARFCKSSDLSDGYTLADAEQAAQEVQKLLRQNHLPVLHIYQHDDQFFAALPDFVDLQESEVFFLDPEYFLYVLDTIASKARARITNAEIDTAFQQAQRTDADKDAAFERAKLNSEHPGRWGKHKEFAVKEEWGE